MPWSLVKSSKSRGSSRRAACYLAAHATFTTHQPILGGLQANSTCHIDVTPTFYCTGIKAYQNSSSRLILIHYTQARNKVTVGIDLFIARYIIDSVPTSHALIIVKKQCSI
jgi:hypothetical protein